jgi:hypothetical protein
MTREIEANFEFHPVGQGCFYTGTIKNGGRIKNKFHFVYDCGTKSKMFFLDKEIKKYKNQLENNSIDLLIISHFDEDHVNGVIDLLKNTHCKRLVIPYYHPLQRLLLFALSSSLDDEYILMLIDPIAYFADENRFKIDEIVVIAGNENSDPPQSTELLPLSPYDNEQRRNFPERLELESMEGKNDYDLETRILQHENRSTGYRNTFFQEVPGKMIISGKVWEFVFYLRDFIETQTIRAFKIEIDQLLNGNSLKMLFNKEFRDKVREIYKLKFKDINITSLCMFHGHLFHHKIAEYIMTGHYLHEYCEFEKHLGTLLTGDINLSSTEWLNHFTKYYQSFLPRVRIFQVPHHGSRKSWNFKNFNGINTFSTYVINHGVGRSSHPSADVILNIENNCQNGRIFLNNEVNEMRYTELYL